MLSNHFYMNQWTFCLGAFKDCPPAHIFFQTVSSHPVITFCSFISVWFGLDIGYKKGRIPQKLQNPNKSILVLPFVRFLQLYNVYHSNVFFPRVFEVCSIHFSLLPFCNTQSILCFLCKSKFFHSSSHLFIKVRGFSIIWSQMKFDLSWHIPWG